MSEMYFEFMLLLACFAGVCLVRSIVLFFAIVEYLMDKDRWFVSREEQL